MRRPAYIIVFLLLMLLPSLRSRAPFKEEAFTQQYNDDVDSLGRDTTDVLFSFKEYFGGVFHKRNSRIGVMFAGSTVFLGFEQIQNKQYWKLPIVYGGLAATTGAGFYFRNQWKQGAGDQYLKYSQWCFWGTGLVYWGTLMDGVVNYKPNVFPQPGRATLYSILVPGLGQVYNKEYWKIPIYWGGMIGAVHFWNLNAVNYRRFRRIYREATDTETTYTGPISAETALYYRDVYRRYRDYSIVTLLGVYLLQVIDANVFAYMHDFEVSDDISMSMGPAVLTPDSQYAFSPSVGMRIGIRF